MQGLMQRQPLLLSSLIRHAARHHPDGEIVSQMGESHRHRTNFAEVEQRSRRLARALEQLGVRSGDRVATLAWNDYRHLELYYAISGMGAVCHTVNPRLSLDDITYIMRHAEDSVIFADPTFIEILEQVVPSVSSLRTAVILADAPEMPRPNLPTNVEIHCYETLVAAADVEYEWPSFDEHSASALCYTSGTTGRPKGVLYSHRSAMLHAYAANTADVFGLRAIDRVLAAGSMFHVTGWALPYCTAMVGAALILPGRYMDGANLVKLINEESVTFTGGVPTIWLDVLAHLRKSGQNLSPLKRMIVAGSACPQLLIEGFASYGVNVLQGWGMTETSPVVTFFAPKPVNADASPAEEISLRLKQGRALCGADVKIVDSEGKELPWDGEAFGDLLCRGPWVTQQYLHLGEESAADEEGWFATGDVATIDPNGYVQLVDRSKDVIKSGGEWISSIALENIAVAHPDVAEAAVINAKHERWMERPLLLVVPRDGRTIAKGDIMKLYEGAVPKWWVPDDMIVVDELPHTATGKLNKLALRDAYGEYLLKAG